MIYLCGLVWDFKNMAVYREMDYKNFNIRLSDAKVELAIWWNGDLYIKEDPYNLLLSYKKGDNAEEVVQRAYKEWIDDQIDKIVL